MRVFCDSGALLDTVRFYQNLTSETLDMDLDLPESGLHVVAVGPFLVLEMDKGRLDRAEQSALTHITVLNANLDEAVEQRVAEGARIVQPRWNSPPGPGIRLRHPDGQLVEHLEHRPSPDDVDEPGPLFRRTETGR